MSFFSGSTYKFSRSRSSSSPRPSSSSEHPIVFELPRSFNKATLAGTHQQITFTGAQGKLNVCFSYMSSECYSCQRTLLVSAYVLNRILWIRSKAMFPSAQRHHSKRIRQISVRSQVEACHGEMFSFPKIL